ncbi:MAG: hypothetical protein HOV79_31930 [Hamadaea sp.]|nr:hypothetical protein [Hamadaea sp.]
MAVPGLVLEIDHIHGHVVSVRLGADGWRPGPPQVRVGRRVIGVTYLASQPASLVTAVCEHGERINLLVVAPRTPGVDAATAMLQAASTGNRLTTAYRAIGPELPGAAAGMRAIDRWEGEGGHL